MCRKAGKKIRWLLIWACRDDQSTAAGPQWGLWAISPEDCGRKLVKRLFQFYFVCLSSHAINSVLTLFFFLNFPAATGSQCSVSREHCCLSECPLVGFVVCILTGVRTCLIGLFVSVTRVCAGPALGPSWRWSSASKSVLHKKKKRREVRIFILSPKGLPSSLL